MFEKILKRERERYICPVCGFLLKHPPENFNICPSCGVEFGYETTSRSIEELREEWLRTGALWASNVHPRPKDFDPTMQLGNIPNITSAPHVSVEQLTFRLIADDGVPELRYVTRHA
jgi:hypothetical protein